ncbi:MAG: DUF362 domain-containing protein [Deltaproteobacteria bacterium]|nr:DUF362 domain-containing protein [Deltaproteobacteria bacterium]
MPKSKVYFADLRSDSDTNLLDKIDLLLERIGVDGLYDRGDIVGLKLHFGERGNTAFVRPQFVRRVVDYVKKTEAHTFLTDTNTLYVGKRTNTVDHLETAILNGFEYSAAGAPLVIADGLRGENKVDVEVDGELLKEVSIAREIVSADGLGFITHFKCHELTGIGGVIKNIGMGCASREGKLVQHAGCPPIVDPEGCTACGKCVPMCPVDAIEMGAVAFIDEDLCTGCSHCIAVCPEGTIKVQWVESAANVQKKMAEYAMGVIKDKREKCFYISFITQVSPLCDCYGHTDAPIVGDIGIVASLDPVALDQACADLVNGEQGIPGTALKSGHECGGDKFRGTHPDIDWTEQLKHAEKIGLGSREYEIEDIGKE